jgi:hypothetical protein
VLHADLTIDRRCADPRITPAAFGYEAERANGRTNVMFRKLTIALLATTLLAAPVLAQSTMGTAGAPATQPAKIVAVKTTAHTAPIFAKAHVKTHKVTKISKVKKHKVKKVKVAKHVKHMTVSKHRIHMSAKPAAPSHQN